MLFGAVCNSGNFNHANFHKMLGSVEISQGVKDSSSCRMSLYCSDMYIFL